MQEQIFEIIFSFVYIFPVLRITQKVHPCHFTDESLMSWQRWILIDCPLIFIRKIIKNCEEIFLRFIKNFFKSIAKNFIRSIDWNWASSSEMYEHQIFVIAFNRRCMLRPFILWKTSLGVLCGFRRVLLSLKRWNFSEG